VSITLGSMLTILKLRVGADRKRESESQRGKFANIESNPHSSKTEECGTRKRKSAAQCCERVAVSDQAPNGRM
jgi:hypothetical protein